MILVVDDDPHIREVIGFALQNAGYSARFAENGLLALDAVSASMPKLIVLDIGLPEMDGLEVCRTLRKTSEVPILFLTARDDEIDRIVGFELGGDDYVTKPFSPRELIARIKAILKRRLPVLKTAGSDRIWGALSLDTSRHLCRFAGAEVSLTASEFSLLDALLRHPEQVFTRPQLRQAVYGSNIHVSDRTIDSHVRNIRAKLANVGCENGIKTVHGVGLRMGQCRV
ncbi:MAG: response regulator transcription factor [Rhodobacteraceae bacterium]|nr:response regulator transcription factor [Paracoccaceae bacterium]